MPHSSYNDTNEDDNLDSESPPNKSLQKRPTDERVPSWSWASIDDAAFMYPAADEKKKKIQVLRPAPSVKTLKTAVTPAYAGGEFDSVASGCLDIKGAMREVTARRVRWSSSPSSPGSVSQSGEIEVPVGGQGHEVVVTLDAASEKEEEEVENDGVGRPGLWLLLLAEQVEKEEEREEEEVVEDDEGQHKFNIGEPTLPALFPLL
ncbi:hypothetical protein B0T13DRAFT_535604 [Neurospora crassa]|nr:hypothetical protein B0T13DRAFT_535604 [Neurospora crassa]